MKKVKMSKIGKIAKCSVCGKEKPIAYEKFSELLQLEKHYCKECDDYSHEKVRCEHCGEEVAREDHADHFRDMYGE